jgi:preprotein translocase subunit SecY
MRTGIKIFLTIVAILIGGFIIVLIKESTGRTHGSGGPIGLIIGFAIIAGIRAIWKYNPNKKENDEHRLNKE